MRRRNFIQSLAAVPFAPSLVPGQLQEAESQDGMSSVWKRRVDEGIVLDSRGERGFQEYSEWVRNAVSAANRYETSKIVNLFDLDLISIQTDNVRWRAHYAHENGLEATILMDTREAVNYDLVVTHVEETWEDHRHYSSDAQIAIADRVRRERDRYLAD